MFSDFKILHIVGYRILEKYSNEMEFFHVEFCIFVKYTNYVACLVGKTSEIRLNIV